ncbi:Transcriptional regulator PadR-like family protein [uncultured archaeon]|nr:Transcriptional regulator PadR-like family protein [uncultured archaeon]
MAKQQPLKRARARPDERPLARLERSLTTDNLWIYILSLLSGQRMHAYAVMEEMEKRFGWRPGLVTPYVVMYKLEEDGFIKGSDKGRRRYYYITQKGKGLLKAAKRRLKETAGLI